MLTRLLYRAMLGSRHLLPSLRSQSFGSHFRHAAIDRIYVINLDRQDERWRRMQHELGRARDQLGLPLTRITRRFSAVDARYCNEAQHRGRIVTRYSLAEQLFVDPRELPEGRVDPERQSVEMTQQEVAVGLSHIGVWELVAAGAPQYTLLLEDDVFFRLGFARDLDRAWADAMCQRSGTAFDLLYLSYQEARGGATKHPVSDHLFEPRRGLWYLSGYVLSQSGAQKLLDLLPVRGPVDLWINHQFQSLDVLATTTSVIDQRRDVDSTNDYSILPVLSKVGILTSEKPQLFKGRNLPTPVIAFGEHGSGLTSLAMALAMLGYRCCSDIEELPTGEHLRLFDKKQDRLFDAYVNVGSFGADDYLQLAQLYRDIRFITTVNGTLGGYGDDGNDAKRIWNEEEADGLKTRASLPRLLIDELRCISSKVCVLPNQHPDKWELLRTFLGCDYPSDPYPECTDQGRRKLRSRAQRRQGDRSCRRLMADPSPWIIRSEDWQGIPLLESRSRSRPHNATVGGHVKHFGKLDPGLWTVRDDTFPSNLALFRPENLTIDSDNIAHLTLRKQCTPVRDYTAACISTINRYLYGRFCVEVRPSAVSGSITGVFLHRNRPRQEIDIEFLGKDPTKMLVNVYYNPGTEGAKMEYGYRGTPAVVELGFDATADFHRYEIEWKATSIRWWVDGEVVHERVPWNPTPVPHLPMQFYVNIWHSRSEELAGKLASDELPAVARLRWIEFSAAQGQETR